MPPMGRLLKRVYSIGGIFKTKRGEYEYALMDYTIGSDVWY